MSVRLRLVLLLALGLTVPAIVASLLTRDLIERAFDLTLSEQVDGGLEAGLSRAQDQLGRSRSELRREALAWVATCRQRSGGLLRELEEGRWPGGPADRVEIVRGARRQVLQAGSIQDDDAAALALRERAPPHRLRVEVPLEAGAALEIQRAVDPQWRRDALAIQEGLQLVRAMAAERERLDRSFWIYFLLIYGVALVLGLAGALWLGHGLTGPLGRLSHATLRLARGDWDVRVREGSGGELGNLEASFNAMVTTLDAQSRRLIDLETMAGWREMARALAHEVKNPLTPIQLTVEEIRQQYDGDDEAYRELVDECTRIVIEEVDSLRRVVARFREFSRPVELQPAPTDINALLRDLGALQRDMEVECRLDPALADRRIELDADRFRQLLLNLAENARHAQEGLPSPRFLLRSLATGDEVELVIEDAGPGIPESERARVFEPYHSGKVGGLGLGLSLVKGIVLAHGGRIAVEEGELGGAAFRISLPTSSAVAASEGG